MKNPKVNSTVKSAAQTRKALWKVWNQVTEVEENEKFFMNLLKEGVAVAADEELIKSENQRRRAGNISENRVKEMRKVLTINKLEDCRKGGTNLRKKRAKLRGDLSKLISERMMKTWISKVKKHCGQVREQLRKRKSKKVEWLKKKYANEKEHTPTEELGIFKNCRLFKEELEPKEVGGVQVILREGETLDISDCEKELLKLGPKYCLLKSCKSESMSCAIESAITKHKWECLNLETDEEPKDQSEEERIEAKRIKDLSEKMGAEARTPFCPKSKTFNLNKKKTTDYKKNSRVILPKAQSAEKESKLEVLRVELEEVHKK